jgi:hypothetical protein
MIDWLFDFGVNMSDILLGIMGSMMDFTDFAIFLAKELTS